MTDETEKHNNNNKFNKMDKKGSFPSTFAASSNKAVTLDSSLKAAAFTRQDGASGSQVSKVQQKGPSRYKGHPSGNPNFRNDSYRNKPSVPRGRGNGDKRGKPRGGSATSESVALGKDEPEAGSLQFPGGKKQNFDDMWGFHFAPREGRNQGYSQMFGHGRSHPPGGGQMRYHYLGGGPNRVKYAKDYLLANCQFLVRMGEDYTVYLADPNILVKWDLIEQVRIRIDGETPKCPICLDFPVAAKITKCGHIYCWSCFLHYLALSDNKVRTCPICYEPVSRKDLKSVTLLSQEGVQIGSRIDMQLMVRAKDSLVAYPVERFAGWESRFCKILQVAPTTVIQTVLYNERVELDFMFASDPNAPEVCFIQEATEELNNREIALTGLQIELGGVEMPTSGLLPPDVIVQTMASTMNVEEVSAVTGVNKPKTRNDSVSSNSSCGLEDSIPAQPQVDSMGDCYFYQIKDGRNVFLHPLNMAMLWRELGSDPEKWPQVLTFEVIDVESKSATEELRKRMKFLRHLPKNTPIDMVEVSMNEWGISPEIYADFASQISQREQRRKKRAKEEKNLEKKLRDREAAEFNKLRNHPQISSPQEFPAFGVGEPGFGLSDFPEQLLVDGARDELPSDESLTTTDIAPGSSGASSFAQIAGKAPLKKSPTFPLPKQGAWGISMAAAAIPTTTHHRHSDSENDTEDYIPVPNYRASVSDAIERAMAGLDLKRAEEEVATPSPPSSGSKKKKNKKGKVLFATGMGGFQ